MHGGAHWMHSATSLIVSDVHPKSQARLDQAGWFMREVHPHEPSLRSYLQNRYPSTRDVDDVVQESYLRLWRAATFHPIDSAKAFLFKVARHVVIDLGRRRQISPIKTVTDLTALPVIEDGPGVVETACTREEIALLADAIDSLPARCREILILRKLRGVPQKAIAAQLGLSEQTVQVQVCRGVKRLAEYLQKPAHLVRPRPHETLR